MAAGPISERNQGNWRGQTQNGLWGFGGPRLGPAVFPLGREILPFRRARDWSRCLMGTGWTRLRPVVVMLCPILCCPPTQKKKKKKKSYRVNLHRNSKLDLGLSIFWKGGVSKSLI